MDRTPRGPRDLRLVTTGRVVSVLGDEVALVALMMRSHDLGLGPFGLTGLLIAFAVPTVVLAGWAGRVVDRFDSRGLIVATSLWQGLACAALAVAPARGPGGVLATYALVVVLQFGSAVGMPTWQALIPSIAGERQVARALGNLQAWSTMASVAGPAVGGQLAAGPGFTTALLVDAASFAVLAALGALVTTRRGPAARPEPHPAGDAEAAGASEAAEAPEARSQATIGGLGLLRRDALLRPMIAGLLVLVVVAEGCNVAEVFMIRDVLRGSSSGFGYVQAVLAVGLVAGSLLAGRLVGSGQLVRGTLLGAGLVGAAILAAAGSPGLVDFAGCWLGLGIGIAAVNACSQTLVLTRTPEANRGRVVAAFMGLARAGSVTALALGGLLTSVFSPRSALLLAGAAALLAAAATAVRTAGFWRARVAVR